MEHRYPPAAALRSDLGVLDLALESSGQGHLCPRGARHRRRRRCPGRHRPGHCSRRRNGTLPREGGGGVRQERQESQSHDFSGVTEALKKYQWRTGKQPLALSGWEVEDACIRPPAQLLRRLAAIRPRLLGYAYPHDFAIAKAHAAETLGWNVTVGGESLCAAQVA